MEAFLKFRNVVVLAALLIFGCDGSDNKNEQTFLLQAESEIDSIHTNKELQTYLEGINQLDQKNRRDESAILLKFGNESKEYEWATERRINADQQNLQRIELILGKFGYPDRDSVGTMAASTPWLVIHHADGYEIRKKYLSTIFHAYLSANINENQMELFLDRMHLIKFDEFFQIKSPYRINDKIDKLLSIHDPSLKIPED